MKYIITEERLNNLIFSYFDNIDWQVRRIGKNGLNLIEGEDGKDVMKFRIENSLTVPDKIYEVIFVRMEFVERICDLFSISPLESKRAIISWFNKTFDKNLSTGNFGWMDSDEIQED